MKKALVLILSALVFFGLSSQMASAASAESGSAAGVCRVKKDIRTVVFSTHLHCANCVKKVQENISYEKGVEDLTVSLGDQKITVTYDASRTSAEKLAEAIRKLGYPATVTAPQDKNDTTDVSH